MSSEGHLCPSFFSISNSRRRWNERGQAMLHGPQMPLQTSNTERAPSSAELLHHSGPADGVPHNAPYPTLAEPPPERRQRDGLILTFFIHTPLAASQKSMSLEDASGEPGARALRQIDDAKSFSTFETSCYENIMGCSVDDHKQSSALFCDAQLVDSCSPREVRKQGVSGSSPYTYCTCESPRRE